MHKTQCQYRYIVIIFIILSQITYSFIFIQTLTAQEIQQKILHQEDLDGDGQPDLTILSASFSTPKDQIRVYDGAHNMRAGTDWQKVTDFTDDTWVFTRGGGETAQLIVQFSKVGQETTAALFSDQNKDGKVGYTVSGAKINITEPLFPTVKVTVQGDWFLPDGQLNWNVRFQTDGSSVIHLDTYNLTDVWNRGQFLALDGNPDIEMEFTDQDHDGIPENGIWRVVSPTPGSEGSMRTWIWSNQGHHRPKQPSNFIYWPYITAELPIEGTTNGVAKPQSNNYFDTPPSIFVSFNGAFVRAVSFSGYPIEQGFHVHSLQPSHKGQANYVDFENIQAYYDLADDHDGTPELHIRHRYFEPQDPYNLNLKVPTNEIRYSWNQANKPGPAWDYKLGLAGRHEITSTVTIDGYDYRMPSYAELPRWVTGTQWDYATFVAIESKNSYLSTEGIYAWSAIESLYRGDPNAISHYIEGTAAIDIGESFQQLPSGFRGDFAPDLQAQPYLYFSPVDRKLHLLKAKQGVWQIDDASQMRYANLGNGPYLDQLTYTSVVTRTQPVTTTRQLDIASSHLLYADDTSVAIRQAQATPALFQTLPPANHQEWQVLGVKLEAHKPNFAPSDFKAMMQQFDGPEMDISGASLRDYRPSGANGFRFVLDLQPGFKVTGKPLANLANLQPGAYVVDYDGTFHVEPLTPPAITIAPPATGPLAARAEALSANQLQLQVANSGREDVVDLRAVAEAIGPDGHTATIGEQRIAVPGEATTPLTFAWTPPTSGDWQIRVTASLTTTAGTTQVVAQHKQRVQIAEPELPSVADTTSTFGLVSMPALAMLLLAVLLVAVLAARALFQAPAADTPERRL